MDANYIYPPTPSTLFPFDFSEKGPRLPGSPGAQNHYTKLPSDRLNDTRRLLAMQAPMAASKPESATQESSTKDDKYFGALQFGIKLDHWKPKQGVAAGKIWIDGSQAGTDDGCSFVSSGFCLGRRHFITAQHFLRGASITPEKRDDCIQKMQNPEFAKVSISVDRKSEHMDKYQNDPTVRYAYLVDQDADLDIAIFRIKDDEEEWDQSIGIGQLAPAINHIWGHIFSVGYSGDCHGPEAEAVYENCWQRIPTILGGQRNQEVSMKFEKLKAEQGKPGFHNIFLPYRRALAFGHLQDAQAGLSQTSDQYIHHTIPVKGGEPDELHNRLIPFTPDSIERIKGLVSLTA
ncbi:MAG: hypothetical protein LQ338_003375 [Usnochroma carphineum]|nr:MAG: hypothetical protein LQ338_003375 [Usnochroma carphineum]